MISDNIIFDMVLIFTGASVLATIFLYLKQPIILAYIALGIMASPSVTSLITKSEEIKVIGINHIGNISHVGIILLLFLLGLNLHPEKLYQLFKKTSIITLGTSFAFAALFMGLSILFGFTLVDSFIIGGCMMFSSTVVSLKLIPTTALHHKHIGAMMTSVLLFQDIIAIVLILFLKAGRSADANVYIEAPFLILKMAGLSFLAFLIVKYVILSLFRKFDIIQEYIFLISLGWCMMMAESAVLLGLSYEMGAFVAGVSIASSPVALVIAERLKPLREFFLILFFFSIGAQFDIVDAKDVIIPGLVMALAVVFLKPFIFSKAFRWNKENDKTSKELGLRLGQASEFSLLLALTAFKTQKITEEASLLIQLVVILTFVISTYFVVYKLPTPIGSPGKRKD